MQLFDEYDDDESDIVKEAASEQRIRGCKRCGSTAVRWRQQGGKWVLFSLTPGVVHRCLNDASKDFGSKR